MSKALTANSKACSIKFMTSPSNIFSQVIMTLITMSPAKMRVRTPACAENTRFFFNSSPRRPLDEAGLFRCVPAAFPLQSALQTQQRRPKLSLLRSSVSSCTEHRNAADSADGPRPACLQAAPQILTYSSGPTTSDHLSRRLSRTTMICSEPAVAARPGRGTLTKSDCCG